MKKLTPLESPPSVPSLRVPEEAYLPAPGARTVVFAAYSKSGTSAVTVDVWRSVLPGLWARVPGARMEVHGSGEVFHVEVPVAHSWEAFLLVAQGRTVDLCCHAGSAGKRKSSGETYGELTRLRAGLTDILSAEKEASADDLLGELYDLLARIPRTTPANGHPVKVQTGPQTPVDAPPADPPAPETPPPEPAPGNVS